MSMTTTNGLRFPCRSGWCAVRGLGLIALWLALVAGFLAQTTVAAVGPASGTQTAAGCPAGPASTS